MKIGTHEVIHVIARNAEMRRVFQGEDKIYEKPEPPVVETDDYVSNRQVGSKNPIHAAFGGAKMRSTDYYPAYEHNFEFTIKCRLSLVDMVDTYFKEYITYYNTTPPALPFQSDVLHLEHKYSRPGNSQRDPYRPGMVGILGSFIPTEGYNDYYNVAIPKTTYCTYNLYALLVDASTHYVRTSSGFKYINEDFHGHVQKESINNQSYSDSSIGFIEFDAGQIDGTYIFVRTTCPSQNEYHTIKGYVDISEDASNNIIEPHLVIDDVDNYTTYYIDKEIDIYDFLHSNTAWSLNRAFDLPIVHASFDNNHNLIMSMGQKFVTEYLKDISDGYEIIDQVQGITYEDWGYFNYDTRVDYASFDIKQHYYYSGYTNDAEWATFDDDPNDFPSYLGSVSYHYLPRIVISNYSSETIRRITLYSQQYVADYTITIDASTHWYVLENCYPYSPIWINGLAYPQYNYCEFWNDFDEPQDDPIGPDYYIPYHCIRSEPIYFNW